MWNPMKISAFLLIFTILAGAAAHAFTDAAPAELDEVLVTGEQPGPGMWRVSNGDHDLWILGTLSPLPKKMTWRSRKAEGIISKSQEVIAPPTISFSVGFFKGLTLVPSVLRARKNSGGQTLKEVLPPNLYPRWVLLKEKYLGRGEGVERLRPSVAARELYVHALDQTGLSSKDMVWDTVVKAAGKQGIPVTPVNLEMKDDNPKETIRQFQKIARDPDVACLASTIERLETDLQSMRQRANRWALGDLAGLRKLPYTDQKITCVNAVASVPYLRDRLVKLRERLTDLWVADAELSLMHNKTTFAVLPLAEITKSDGWLARLRARGMTVQDP
jgi:uncharacterized protein YbaP (TraB family)